MSDIKSYKDAYEEGWHDGHHQGITCGHDLAPRCNTKKEFADDLECSDAAQLSNAWISVDDRLPEDGGYVLISDGDDVCMGFKDKHKGGEYMDVAAESIICCMDITHWMPLPSPSEAK